MDELPPHEGLTQYGRVTEDGGEFKRRPDPQIGALSLLRGRVGIAKATAQVCYGRSTRPGDAVRHTEASTLVDQGFRLYADRPQESPWHVRVEYSGAWDDDVGKKFDDWMWVRNLMTALENQSWRSSVGDSISIQPGLAPWRPSPDAELIETIHFFNVPLGGVVEQGGSRFVFWCVDGHVDNESLWAYAIVDDRDLDEIRRTERPEEVLLAKEYPMPVVVALARDGIRDDGGLGLISSALVSHPEQFDSMLQAALAVFRSAEQEIEAFNEAAS